MFRLEGRLLHVEDEIFIVRKGTLNINFILAASMAIKF